MDVKIHFGFSAQMDSEVLAFLIKNAIPYDSQKDSDIISGDIYASSPYWTELDALAEKHHVVLTCEQVFTKEELNSAEWMFVRSRWHNGWAQPEDEFFPYKSTTFSCEEFCNKCQTGLIQRAPFRLIKEPTWKNRHFFSLYDFLDELFISNYAQEILQKSEITGMTFYDVENKNGKRLLEGVMQIDIQHMIPNGLVEEGNVVKESTICPQCGRKRYLLNEFVKTRYKRECFENAPDIVKTQDLFGAQIGIRYILIRQKLYQTIINNKLDRSLVFCPIELV